MTLRLLIRYNGGPATGGGQVMRCLTLAEAAADTGAAVAVVTVQGGMQDRVAKAGFMYHPVPTPRLHPTPPPRRPAAWPLAGRTLAG